MQLNFVTRECKEMSCVLVLKRMNEQFKYFASAKHTKNETQSECSHTKKIRIISIYPQTQLTIQIDSPASMCYT